MVVKTYRKKPVEVEAFQVNALDSKAVDQIKKWVDNDDDYVEVNVCDEDDNEIDFDDDDFDEYADHIEIVSDEKGLVFKVYVGNYVVKGIDGSVYPVSESTFEKSYEEATENKVFSKAIVW